MAAAPDAPAQRRLALIVASSDYHDPTLQRLRAPGRDAEALAEVLGNPAIGAFDVRTLLNASSTELLRGIAEFCTDSRPTDLLLVYFSCHGLLDDHGRLYYATVNTERRLLAATSVSAQWLNDQLEDCPARRQLLVLDCCHSGAFERGMRGEADLALESRFGSRGRVVLTASRATEYSFEGDDVLRQGGATSFFTAALVQGLRTGDADRDKDGFVTATELYEHVFEKTRAGEKRQTPLLWARGTEGNLLVARSPRGPAPAALPDDLRAILESARPRVRESAVGELAELLDDAEPRLATTARRTLEKVAENDIPRVAALARAALAADTGGAADQVRSDLEERARREAEQEERARREAEQEERARREAEQEERVRREAEEQERVRREAEEQERVRREAEQQERVRREAEQQERVRREAEGAATESSAIEPDRPTGLRYRVAHVLSRRRAVLITTSIGLASVTLLIAFLGVPSPTAAIVRHLPDLAGVRCTATADDAATCNLADGTVVFYRLSDTVDEARMDILNGTTPPAGASSCPPSSPPTDWAVVCRYAVGAARGVAHFSYVAKDPHRFYLVRWSPDADPNLQGEMSTANADPEDWTALQANWSRLAGAT